MIKEKSLKIDITVRNITHYKNLGYDIKINNTYDIKIEDINKSSHIKITAICEKCGAETIIPLFKYYINKNNHDYYSCKKCSRLKFKLTSNILFGADNPMQNSKIKEKAENSNIEKYGFKTSLLNEVIKEKIKNTNLEKYGFESHLKNDEIRDKIKKTMIEKYDVEYPLQNEEIRLKTNKTNLEKYGVEHPAQNEDIKIKTNKTNLEKYGCSSPLKSEIVKLKLQEKYKNKYNKINIVDVEDKHLAIICDDCCLEYRISKTLFNHKIAENVNLCPKCNPPSNSVKENDIYKFISDNYNGEIITNSKSILPPLELDIYIPELKLALEYNGIYWHNELNKDDDYHFNKTEDCEKLGIQLIHIWEDDWLYKQDIVKSIIMNKIGKTSNKIFARKCQIKELLDNNKIREFLNRNHIQGFVGAKVKIGLFYNNELVSLMTFGSKRISMDEKTTIYGKYEMLRFCNELNTNVVGGASKLFKYFIENYKPDEITTYADRTISQGKLYETLGFIFDKKTQPNYYYVISRNRYNRFNFRKDILVKQGYDKNKTEHNIMLERKIYRIYDSGNLKYTYKNDLNI